MFKIITLMIITTGLAFSDFNPISIDNMMNKSTKINGNEKKVYSELIDFLSQSTSGEYAVYLAVIYLNGISQPDDNGEVIEVDVDKAILFFEKAINLEYFQASAILGSLYLFDEKLSSKEQNIKKAKYYLKIAIDKEIYEATMALSNIYFYYEKDIEKGLKYLHIGANKDVATAELSLATLYGYGSKELGIKKNLVIGNQFLEKACSNKKKTEKVEEFCSSKSVLNYKKR